MADCQLLSLTDRYFVLVSVVRPTQKREAKLKVSISAEPHS
jgi:hypothetical protein